MARTATESYETKNKTKNETKKPVYTSLEIEIPRRAFAITEVDPALPDSFCRNEGTVTNIIHGTRFVVWNTILHTDFLPEDYPIINKK